MGLLHLHQLLPMVLLGPFTFSKGIANALGWAYHIGAADAPEWAHHNSCCCWPRHRSGPLFFRQMLPMASPGPIYFSGGTSDALGWAHCNSSSCHQKLRFGPLSLQQMLSIPWGGTIALAAA